MAFVFLLLGTASSFGQKKDPATVPHNTPARSTSSVKSYNSDAVEAVLKNRRSNTASELTKLEHSGMVHSAPAHPTDARSTAPKSFAIPQNNKNKPMNASHPSKNGGRHVPSVRTKGTNAG